MGLGINAGFFIVQVINFAVLFLILLAVWPRVTKFLDDRAARIAKSLEDARVAEQARANAEREAQKILDERRAEGSKLVEEARGQADVQAKALVEQARVDAEGIRAKARQDAEEERSQLLSEVRGQVVQLALAASERLIGQSLSIDQNRAQQIVSDFFTKSTADLKNLGGTVEVTTALPLNDGEKNQLTAQIGAQAVNFKVDPGILGGVIARSGDRVIDGSVRAELNELANRLR
jgi:F-type H+-transporting ATPase subunit b